MQNTAVITFGRFNPVTIGHEKLVTKVAQMAELCHADPIVYLTHTMDNEKNPLDYLTKLLLVKTAFPFVNVQPSTAKTIIHVMQELEHKYYNVIVVVGSDRVVEFDTLLNKYNGKDYSFNNIMVASGGSRDPDSDEVDGMSATKMREAALNDDLNTFDQGLPVRLRPMSTHIMNQVRKGLL